MMDNPNSLKNFLYGAMHLNGMKLHPDSWDTLVGAVDLKQYKFLDDENGKASGFLIWNFVDGKILINSLTIFPNKRGHVPLMYLRKFFRDKYPGSKFGWHNDKHEKLLEVV